VRFRVPELERLRRVAFEVNLPVGIVNHEVVVFAAESDTVRRVTYN
jgi:hypothetical protein